MPRRAPLGFLMLLACCAPGLGALLGAGCSDDAGGTTGPGGPKACDVDAQCDDGNPCSTDVCGEAKRCTYEPLPDQTVDDVPGDCRRTVCVSGLAQEEDDPGDVADDDEECTLDTCEGGEPVHLVKIEEHPCFVGNGEGACHSGRCVVLCTPDTAAYACDDLNGCTDDACVPCTEAYCTTGSKCDHAKLSNIPVPNVGEIPGDCIEARCVEGKETEVAVPDDLPVDGDDCTEDICDGTIPVNHDIPEGAACTESGTRVCTGDHRCVPPCAVDGSCRIYLFASYSGGTFTINVDVDAPDMIIGLVSYEPMMVTITGAFAEAVQGVHYIGYDSGGTTAVQGVGADVFWKGAASTTVYPDCFSGSTGTCDPFSDDAAYFLDMFGGTLVSHLCQYNAYSGALTLSDPQATCAP